MHMYECVWIYTLSSRFTHMHTYSIPFIKQIMSFFLNQMCLKILSKKECFSWLVFSPMWVGLELEHTGI